MDAGTVVVFTSYMSLFSSPKTQAIMGSTARNTAPVKTGDMESIKKVTINILQIINVVVVKEDYRMLALVVVGMVFLAFLDIGITFVHQILSGIMGQGVIQPLLKPGIWKA